LVLDIVFEQSLTDTVQFKAWIHGGRIGHTEHADYTLDDDLFTHPFVVNSYHLLVPGLEYPVLERLPFQESSAIFTCLSSLRPVYPTSFVMGDLCHYGV
jgi:hypothetical protein